MTAIIIAAPGPIFQDPNQQAIHENASVNASGSMVLTGYGVSEVSLFINVKAVPSGVAPTLQYSIQEVDPGDGVTVIGNIATSTVISGPGIQRITLESTFGGSILVTWTLGGIAPVFNQVYATLVGKAASAKLVDENGNPITISGGSLSVTGVVTAQDPSIVLPSSGTRNSIIDPSGNQTSNYQNSIAPVAAVLSNSVPSYGTLGGLWRFSSVSGSETDYALFGYQVPVGVSLYVRSLIIGAFVMGVQNSAKPTILQWAIAANSSGASLSTGPPSPPIFLPVGMQTAATSARAGESFEPGPVLFEPDSPVVVSPTKFFHVLLRIPVGNATPNQEVRGFCMIDGYFE
jgi:hypothetical protein